MATATKTISQINTILDRLDLSSKKWVIFGDSFSNMDAPVDYPYGVISKLGLTGTVTHAIAGYKLSDQINILEALLASNSNYFDDFDICSLFIGVNDFASSTVALGNRNSAQADATFAGKLKYFIALVKNSNPAIQIYVITPPEMDNADKAYGATNGQGWRLRDLSVLISQIASDKAVQCIDLYSLSGFSSNTIAHLTSDGLHPNEVGSAIIADIIARAFSGRNSQGKSIDTASPVLFDELLTLRNGMFVGETGDGPGYVDFFRQTVLIPDSPSNVTRVGYDFTRKAFCILHNYSGTLRKYFFDDAGLFTAPVGFKIGLTPGVSGSYTTADGKTVTVVGGIITSIV